MLQVEDESDDGSDEDHTFVDIPSTSADDQPGPSGVGKDGSEAPWVLFSKFNQTVCYLNVQNNYSFVCEKTGKHFMWTISIL